MNVAAIDNSENIWLSLINQQLKKSAQLENTEAAAQTAGTEATSGIQSASDIDFSQLITSKLDTDGDGAISTEEYQQGLSDARSLLSSLDSQKSQMRAFESQNTENVQKISPAAVENAENSQGATAFSQFDTNNDGTISTQEFSIGMEAMQAKMKLEQQQVASSEESSGLSSYFSSESFSIPGLMGGMGDLMTFMGQGQGNMPAYNMLMDQLLQR